MRALSPELRLSSWLLQNHPDIFNALFQQAKKSGFSGLGDDVTDYSGGTTTLFSSDTTDTLPVVTVTNTAFDAGNGTVIDASGYSPPTPDLNSLVVDPSSLSAPSFNAGASTTPSFAVDTSGSSGSGAAINTVANSMSGGASSAGLTLLASISRALFGPTSAQGATINTQVARVAACSNPAPIGYGVNAAGQVVPIYTGATVPLGVAGGTPALTTAGVAGVSLSPSTLASLLPTSTTGLAVLGIGLALLIGLGSRSQRK